MPSAIETAANNYRRELAAVEIGAQTVLGLAYRAARARLVGRIEALVEEIGANPKLTSTQALTLQRAVELFDQIEAEMAGLGRLATPLLTDRQRRAVALAREHALGQTLVAGGPKNGARIAASWNHLAADATTELVGRLRDGSPLRDSLDALGPTTSETIREALTSGIATGTNPNDIAAMLARKLDTMGLVRLNLIARSAILDSHRAATLRAYAANGDVLDGWVWTAAKDARTCLACLGLDGQTFPLSETFMASHAACRCAARPWVKGADPNADYQTGEEWLDAQPEAVQRAMIPKGAWDDYAAGRIVLDDFTALRRDKQWGDSYHEATLREAYRMAERRNRRAAA